MAQSTHMVSLDFDRAMGVAKKVVHRNDVRAAIHYNDEIDADDMLQVAAERLLLHQAKGKEFENWSHHDGWVALFCRGAMLQHARDLQWGGNYHITKGASNYGEQHRKQMLPLLAREGYEMPAGVEQRYYEPDFADDVRLEVDLERLPEKTREVFDLLVAGYTWKEIARSQGISAVALKQRTQRHFMRIGLISFDQEWMLESRKERLQRLRGDEHFLRRILDQSERGHSNQSLSKTHEISPLVVAELLALARALDS